MIPAMEGGKSSVENTIRTAEFIGSIKGFANGFNLTYKNEEGDEEVIFCLLTKDMENSDVLRFAHHRVRVKLVSDEYSVGFPYRIAEISPVDEEAKKGITSLGLRLS